MKVSEKLKEKFAHLLKWWNRVNAQLYGQIIRLPFVGVNREDYLRHVLSHFYKGEELDRAVADGPVGHLPQKTLHKMCRACVLKYSLLSSLLSGLAAVPDDFILQMALMVFDIVQFQIMLFIVSQKLLFLHGFKENPGDDNSRLVHKAVVLLGVVNLFMVGKNRIAYLAKKAAKTAARKAIKLGAGAPGRIFLINILRQFLKWTGVNVTRETLNLSIECFLVTFCCVMSAAVSFWLFFPICSNLDHDLEEKGVDKVIGDLKASKA